MSWVRLDDQYPINRKVRGLSDSAFRLHTEALCWCARNLTDGFVPAADLLDVASARRPLKFVPELVIRLCWHLVDEDCDSKKCPAHPDRRAARTDELSDGWLIHDYFEYQFSKAQVMKEREANAERQRRYRGKKPESHSESNGVSNGVTSGVSTGPPSRPDPTRRDGSALSAGRTGDQSVRAGARVREATRYLQHRYDGLTDQEALRVISEVEARAREPIKKLAKYVDSMAEGDLADIVSAVMDARDHPADPDPPPPPAAVPDRPGPRRTPDPGPVQPPLLQAVPDAPDQPVEYDPDTGLPAAAAAAMNDLRARKGWRRATP